MLNNLATTSSMCAGSVAPAAPVAASTALTGRPAAISASYATRGRFTQAGMDLSNHNIKVWPLGPQDGSTG